MPTKKETQKKTRTHTVRKTNAPVKKGTKTNSRETLVELKKKISEIEDQMRSSTEEYGKLLEYVSNNRIKLDVMLGQIIKALFIVGIGPEEIARKCSQMFSKVGN